MPGMKTLRTPDERFRDLPGFPFDPHYTEVPDGDGGTLRIHHVDAGPTAGEIVRNDLHRPHGFEVHGVPALLHFSRQIDVVVWSPERCGPNR